MPNEDNKILTIQPWRKVYDSSIYCYTDLESLLEKMNTCHNNEVL